MNNEQVNSILAKYKIPVVIQEKVLKILGDGVFLAGIEGDHYNTKANFKLTEDLHLDILKKEVPLLINNSPSKAHTNEEKIKFLLMWDHYVNIEVNRRFFSKAVQKVTGKGTVNKVQKNLRNKKTYTILINELVNVINPVFRHPLKDKLTPRSRRKEAAFVVVKDIINATFPGLNFTPKQIKARYH